MAVLTHGGTSAAARALHVSQPATARAIAQLERELGVLLFDRSHRGMHPTEAGDALLKRARETLTHLARADAGPWRVPLQGGRLAAQATAAQLEAILLLAKAGSQRQVAALLGVSQASVQQALAQMEHLAGEPLFDRLASGLRPTSRGAWVARQAELALVEMRAMTEDAAALLGNMRGQLTIGTLPYSTGTIVPEAIQNVTSRWAGLQVSVVDGTYESLMIKLRQAEIDIVVGALRPEVPRDLNQTPLFQDPLSIVVRAGHPLLKKRRLTLSQLSAAQWVLPMPGSPAGQALAHIFSAQSLPTPEGVYINSPTLVCAMLHQSDRLTLMPPSQWKRELQAGLLDTLKVPAKHAPRSIGFTVRASFAPTPLLRAFQEALVQAVPG